MSPTARLDAELLLAHSVGLSRAAVLANGNQVLDNTAWRSYQQLIVRRSNREPVAYILGEREFYGLTFTVDSRVLIPRPETELLVELAIQLARDERQGDRETGRRGDRLKAGVATPPLQHSTAPTFHRSTAPPLRILDLCTGSGCIAIALAHHVPYAQIVATDLSVDALAVARLNVEHYRLGERVELRQGDLFAAVDGEFDLIVSNPPYTILQQVEAGVYQYEPHLALDGGMDGLSFYRKLIVEASHFLASHGTILLEIGADQGAAVAAMARHSWPTATVTVHTDLAGLDRAVQVTIR
jgi:release factor glutamine methyltransferase